MKVTDAQALTSTTLENLKAWTAPTPPAAWQAVRLAATKALENGFPEARNEEYKFTNLSKALAKTFTVGSATQAGKVSADEVLPFEVPALEADRIVLVNGQYREDLSDLSNQAGLTVSTLVEGAQKNAEVFQKIFGQLANVEADAFTALNTAFVTDGVMIHIRPKSDLKRPIAIYNLIDARTEVAQAYPRVLVYSGAGSRAQIITSIHTLGDHPSLNAFVGEAYLEDNAELNWVKLQNDSGDAYHYDHTEAYQSRDSRFTATTVSLRGTMIRNNLNVQVDAANVESNMYGLTMLRGKQHVDHHTVVDHLKPHSNSNELYKIVLDEKSTGVFNGKIFVRQDAQKTNAFQANNTILLSDEATIHAKPQLEIWADDVKCSHGATTGQIDEEQLFYLRSRGLSETQGRAMLLNAFANDALELIPQAAVTEYLENQISDRLNA